MVEVSLSPAFVPKGMCRLMHAWSVVCYCCCLAAGLVLLPPAAASGHMAVSGWPGSAFGLLGLKKGQLACKVWLVK